MSNEPILVTRSSIPPLEEYMEEIKSIWDTHWLTNMGDKHHQLQRELKRYLGVENVELYVNGHTALECAFEAYELKGKVITTPFTFASTTHALVRVGLTPVFADVDPHTYTIDPQCIEELIDEDTCAIVPVHVYGNLCDVDAIDEIAKKHNLKVIYDAAHAFGVTKNGISSAAFGDASMFSFHATKVFNTIEGGAVCYRDPSMAKSLEVWKNFGITGPDQVEYVGGNAKMNEFAAAMGICNLRHLEDEIAKRKVVHDRYFEHLDGASGLTLCHEQSGVTSNYAYLPVIFEDSFGASRDDVMAALRKEAIFTRKYFYPLTSEFSCYKGKYVGKTPIAKHYSSRVLTLPMYADLSLEDVDHICRIILQCQLS